MKDIYIYLKDVKIDPKQPGSWSNNFGIWSEIFFMQLDKVFSMKFEKSRFLVLFQVLTFS